MSDLLALSKPLPDRFIQKNPSGGGVYVAHPIINQKLLATIGPFNFELVEIIRGNLKGKAPNPRAESKRGKEGTPDLTAVIVGAVCRLTAEVDGRTVRIEEVGDCEDPYNWPHDGARMKDAMSDALKRCAMRLGLGLHLWSKQPGDYVLHQALSNTESAPSAPQPNVDPPTPAEAERPGVVSGKRAEEAATEQEAATPAAAPAPEPDAESNDLAGPGSGDTTSVVETRASGSQSAPAPSSTRGGEHITPQQRAKLFALIPASHKDRDARLAYVSALLDREIASFNSISKAEAITLLGHVGVDGTEHRGGTA